MKIVREHTAALCILGCSGVPVLRIRQGLNVVQTRASVKIRMLAESGACTQAPREAREYTFRYRMLLHGK